MTVIMRAVLTRMLVIMDIGITVIMGVFVLVLMGMSMFMIVLMAVLPVAMRMLVLMLMSVFMLVLMLMFMSTFHVPLLEKKLWDDEAVMAKNFLSPFRHNRPFFEKVTSYSSPDNRTASSFYRAKRLNRLKCLKSE